MTRFQILILVAFASFWCGRFSTHATVHQLEQEQYRIKLEQFREQSQSEMGWYLAGQSYNPATETVAPVERCCDKVGGR
jgi:hypothetical protein